MFENRFYLAEQDFSSFGWVWYGLVDFSCWFKTLNAWFSNYDGYFGMVFYGQSFGNVKSAVQLYKSADLYIDFTLSLDTVDGFW